MKYTIDFDTNNLKYDKHITKTMMKYFKLGQEYCIKHDMLGCKIKNTTIMFDFGLLEVVFVNNWGKNTYKLKEIKHK